MHRAPSTPVCVSPSSRADTQLWVVLKLLETPGIIFLLMYLLLFLKPLLGRIAEEHSTDESLPRLDLLVFGDSLAV